jgi:predicted 3-demethylubiquinone-9 3-methyltransferase (glyoxalase superfamily)
MKSNRIYPCLWFDGKAKEAADSSHSSGQSDERSFQIGDVYKGFSSDEEI